MKKSIMVAMIAASGLAFTGCASAANPSPSTSDTATSRNIIAIGDSVSAASNSCGKHLACYGNSWVTGSNPAVDSLAMRLNASEKEPYGAKNYSVLGTKLSGLGEQLKEALAARPAYLTLLTGGNDFCTPSVQEMTSASDFEADFKKLVELVHAASPGTQLVVASTPNPTAIYEAGKDNPAARKAWASGSICQSMLAAPLDDSSAAQARRAQVVQRAAAFNRAMEENCNAGCTYDGGAVNDLTLKAADISKVDYFHMSVSGQAKIAATVWQRATAATK